MNIRAIETRGSDAPHRQAKLNVCAQYNNEFAAYWEPGFCGCGEEGCNSIVGRGASEQEAIADYWERWEEKHGPTTRSL